MELSYRELAKKDVINITDGRCLGRIIDMKFKFPQGVIVGIVVPGRRTGFFKFFDRSELYIDESKIIKIGGDVILVDLKCSDTCAPNVKVKGSLIEHNRPQENCPQSPHCPPPCPPPCPPNCPPPKKPQNTSGEGVFRIDFSDLDDY
jgi:YlmC/YmxH family sporulation protein